MADLAPEQEKQGYEVTALTLAQESRTGKWSPRPTAKNAGDRVWRWNRPRIRGR